ncbi:MAG: glutamate mutase L, partial [Treponema sp.]|nr:glutamate mutase L [Treponema sp.]
NSEDPVSILKAALYDQGQFLKPKAPRFFLDGKYIFASMGLVAKIDPRLALTIMEDEILEI